MEHAFWGTHILIEIYEVDIEKFSNADEIIYRLEDGIKRAGATLIKTCSFKFEPTGLTIVSILKESHVSIHTYPEQNAAFIDAFTCGNIEPEIITQALIKYFEPKRIHTQTIERGFKDIVS